MNVFGLLRGDCALPSICLATLRGFLVTPDAVAKAVELIRSGEIKNWVYDAKKADFVKMDV